MNDSIEHQPDRQTPAQPAAPMAEVRRRPRFSLIWLVPILALIVGAILVYRAYAEAGPKITVTFKTAESLIAGQTEVRYKHVAIGKVKDIDLTDDNSLVQVEIALRKSAADIAVEGSRFWVVRPRLDTGGVSGLTTLVTGAYIETDPGQSGEPQRAFSGLEQPPVVTGDEAGTRYRLVSDDLGSVDVGSAIYYRRLPVGRIADFELTDDGESIEMQVFVEAPFDRYVTADTRFWNASGVELSTSGGGVELRTESLAAIVLGGIAFDKPNRSQTTEQAPENTEFRLFDKHSAAMALPDGDAVVARMHFDNSIKGLAPGSPIDFKGVVVGAVTEIELDYEPNSGAFLAEVTADVYPQRLGRAYRQLSASMAGGANLPGAVMQGLIESGLIAQLQTANLLTGQLAVVLDFAEDDAALTMVRPERERAGIIEIPTAASALAQIQQQISDILGKLSDLPLEDMAGDLSDVLKAAEGTLRSAQSAIGRVDEELLPKVDDVLDSLQDTMQSVETVVDQDQSGVMLELQDTLDEVGRAARSVRVLAEELQRNPQSLIRGRPDIDDADVGLDARPAGGPRR